MLLAIRKLPWYATFELLVNCPPLLHKQVFGAIHELSHPSIWTIWKLIAAKFIWHGLRKKVGLGDKAVYGLPKS